MLAIAGVGCAMIFSATAAQAQVGEGLLVPAVIPEGFDEGRNVSVQERPRPYFNALGATLGAFTVLPQVEIGSGVTSNVYLTPRDTTSAAFVSVRPAVAVRSGWSRHSLSFNADGELRKFVGQSARNEDSFNLGSAGRLDLTSNLSISGNLAATRSFENSFSGEVIPTVAALSHFRRLFGAIRSQYQMGRIRAIYSMDTTNLRFDPLRLRSGLSRDQSERDRTFTRVTGQVEYAETPSVAFFGQFGYGRANYRRPGTITSPARDSGGYRVLGGMNFDLAARARGSLGIGYSHRSYDSPQYRNVGGISAEGSLEVFPTNFVTVSVKARRVLEDTQIGNSPAFWDNRITLGADYELLRNLILNASAQIAKTDYLASSRQSDNHLVSLGGRYLSTRHIELKATVSYSDRAPQTDDRSSSFNELRAQFGIVAKL